MTLRSILPRRLGGIARLAVEATSYPVDFTPADVALCASVAPYTMTSPERIVALAEAVRYVVRRGIAGAVVECGVWRGGSTMAAALTLIAAGDTARDLYLFDTFAGMTAPDARDRAHTGETAEAILAREPRYQCIADAADVAANLVRTGYPSDRTRLVRGDVLDTIPADAPDAIALLRLDTDWYASTRHELEHLYPRLVSGGILIIDDYGHWQGARHAVDEYFASVPAAPLLVRIDYTARMAVKP